MRATQRIELSELTQRELQWLKYSRNGWLGPTICANYKQMLVHSLRQRLVEQDKVFIGALMWIHTDHIQVYVPTRPFRSNTRRAKLTLV